MPLRHTRPMRPVRQQRLAGASSAFTTSTTTLGRALVLTGSAILAWCQELKRLEGQTVRRWGRPVEVLAATKPPKNRKSRTERPIAHSRPRRCRNVTRQRSAPNTARPRAALARAMRRGPVPGATPGALAFRSGHARARAATPPRKNGKARGSCSERSGHDPATTYSRGTYRPTTIGG